jgi:hypothetical protein
LDGIDTLPPNAANAQSLPAIVHQCWPDPADIPTGERAVRRELLHLLRDFLSVGHFAVHERKFSRYFKRIF